MTGMTNGVITGYDGSICSDEALRWAAREAWARGTALTICLAWPTADLFLLGDWGARDRAQQLGGDILARGVRLAGAIPDLPDVRTVLAVFDRPDEEIRIEITGQVIPRLSEPSWYVVRVKDGIVTLEGTPETISIGRQVLAQVRHVQGVGAVQDRRTYPLPPVPAAPGPYF